MTLIHNHSHFSLLRALPKIKQLVGAAKKNGYSCLALTDDANLYGAIEFYKACKDEGIKPIIGVCCYMPPVSFGNQIEKYPRIILLAENVKGYHNLIDLVTETNLNNLDKYPITTRELLKKYRDDVIAVMPYLNSEITVTEKGKREDLIREYRAIFPGRLYLGVEPKDTKNVERRQEMINFSKSLDIPMVAEKMIYYLESGDGLVRKNVLLNIQNTMDFYDDELNETDLSMVKKEVFEELFDDIPEACISNDEIRDNCNLEIELGKWTFPTPDVEGDIVGALRERVSEGAKELGMKVDGVVKKRIDYELDVIISKGYTPYFLVVADIFHFAKEQGIITNTRGSVAGSLVSYLLGITNVDPLEYKLPFERFLNPERPSAPDIDVDFQDDRREEILNYVKEKYGKKKFARIGTFGTMLARAVVRDTARALGYSYTSGDRIARLIPPQKQGFPMYIKDALMESKELKELYDSDEEVKRIVDVARRMEGNARHISIHAGGVVIAPTPLTDFVPLQFDTKEGNKVITQYDMYSIEEAGLLKFDFLGITQLSAIAEALRLVEKNCGEKVNLSKIPLDDKDTFEMFTKGNIVGVFQFSGSVIKNLVKSYLRKLKPKSIHDINAMIALLRPGPMKVIPEYIDRKHGRKKVEYIHPNLEKYMKESYGLWVYQEDIMMTAIELAGYSWLEADMLRKAIGKKIPALMREQKKKLIEGIMKHSKLSEKKAEYVWSMTEPFQGYGFGKAHAASYGQISYQTAYLKTHYTADYMAACMTSDSGNIDKITEYIAECRKLSVPIIRPDINLSGLKFDTEKTEDGGGGRGIRFGLLSIKNLGDNAAEAIVSMRKSGGKYITITDFMSRMPREVINKKNLEALIYSGCLDDFGDRGDLIANMESLLEFKKEISNISPNQNTLFEIDNKEEIKLVNKADLNDEEKLFREREILGVYLSGHPLFKHRESPKSKDLPKISDLVEGKNTLILGTIGMVNYRRTRDGRRMAVLLLEDEESFIECACFPDSYEKFEEFISPHRSIWVRGRMRRNRDLVSFVAEEILDPQ
ncbi:MAG: DNA polymerase III subunit alpha [Candidatus Campbellbacteria bacterium]|nr:DNA polymerase III subunit alpha [Candidatus Campbellbacteria bacterium]